MLYWARFFLLNVSFTEYNAAVFHINLYENLHEHDELKILFKKLPQVSSKILGPISGYQISSLIHSLVHTSTPFSVMIAISSALSHDAMMVLLFF